jgi:hypothetical protein
MKNAGYTILALLLILIACSVWAGSRFEKSDGVPFFSHATAARITDACTITAYVAIAFAGMIVVRAFGQGLKGSPRKSQEKAEATKGASV